jgi:hypothetical protein
MTSGMGAPRMVHRYPTKLGTLNHFIARTYVTLDMTVRIENQCFRAANFLSPLPPPS